MSSINAERTTADCRGVGHAARAAGVEQKEKACGVTTIREKVSQTQATVEQIER